MANLPSSTLTAIFELQRQIAESVRESVAETSSIEWQLLKMIGENEQTMPEFEELQNIKERLTSAFSRLSVLLLRIMEA